MARFVESDPPIDTVFSPVLEDVVDWCELATAEAYLTGTLIVGGNPALR
jgi:hypothetical protein